MGVSRQKSEKLETKPILSKVHCQKWSRPTEARESLFSIGPQRVEEPCLPGKLGGGHHPNQLGNDWRTSKTQKTHGKGSPSGDESVGSISDGLSLGRQGDGGDGCGQDQGVGEEQQGNVIVQGASEAGVLDDARNLDDLSSAVVQSRTGADPPPDGVCSVEQNYINPT